MTNSRISATFFQMKSAANIRERPARATAMISARIAFDADRKEFEALYENHHRPVYRLCARMTQNADVAEDLTQRVFVGLFKNLKNLRNDSELNTRILQLATDELLCYFLQDDGRFNRFGDSGFCKNTFRNEAKRQTSKSAFNRHAVEKAIAQLPVDYRLIFLLHDFERLTHEEIARILKIDVATSKSNLHEARINLHRRLTK